MNIGLKTLKQMPHPKQHWLKGNLGQFELAKIHSYFYSVAKEYGGSAKVRLLTKKFIIFQNADTIQELLKSRPDRFRRAKIIEKIFTEMGVHGVFSSEKEDWKKQRLLINPAFKPSQIKEFYPKIVEITARLCEKLSHSSENVDIQEILMSYTVDITSTLAFGSDVNTLDNSDTVLQSNLNVIFPTISYRLRAALPYWRLFKLKRDRDLDSALAVVNKHVNNFIDVSRKNISIKGLISVSQATNFLEAIILSKNEKNEGFSEQEIIGNVITLLLAGEDTTANTLSWAIDFLADRADLQDELYNEILRNLSVDGAIALDDLQEYPLVSAVIHETLRLKPVAPHVYLEPINDEVVEDYLIPAGTLIVALLSGDSFNESLFPDCYKFDPHRWTNITDFQKKEFGSRLMPFGYGARLCPGRQLSLVEMRLSLIEILKRFRITRTAGTSSAGEALKFTLQPIGLRVDFIERKV